LAPSAAMTELRPPLQFVAGWIGTWLTRHQERAIDYLKEENRVLREKVGGRIRLTDSERRRLARLGKAVGRKALGQLACIASPDSLLRWYRELVARKYGGSKKRGPGRPRKPFGDRSVLGEDGDGESALVVHVVAWGAEQRGLRDRPDDDQAAPKEQGIDPGPNGGRGMSWAQDGVRVPLLAQNLNRLRLSVRRARRCDEWFWLCSRFAVNIRFERARASRVCSRDGLGVLGSGRVAVSEYAHAKRPMVATTVAELGTPSPGSPSCRVGRTERADAGSAPFTRTCRDKIVPVRATCRRPFTLRSSSAPSEQRELEVGGTE